MKMVHGDKWPAVVAKRERASGARLFNVAYAGVLRSDFARDLEHVLHQWHVLPREVIDVANVPLRYSQAMVRSRRSNVTKAKHIVVFIHNGRRQLSA
jgi:hypothetical protein